MTFPGPDLDLELDNTCHFHKKKLTVTLLVKSLRGGKSMSLILVKFLVMAYHYHWNVIKSHLGGAEMKSLPQI